MKQIASSLISVLTSAILIAALILMITIRDAHAYIDAGTGSLLIQFLLAGMFGSIFMIKMFWRSLVGRFNRMLSKIKGS